MIIEYSAFFIEAEFPASLTKLPFKNRSRYPRYPLVMLIAQLSDLHVRPAGELYKGVADSNGMLRQAIEHVQSLDQTPDLVLLTGDLVDEGHPEEYQSAVALLSALKIPYRLLPGNHDDRTHLRAAFGSHLYLGDEGPINYCVDDYPVRIVALDSSVPMRHHGHLDDESLSWLRDCLAADRHKPTIIVLHHPPFSCGVPYLDRYRYFAAEALAEIIAASGNIEAVLCGHVHRAMMRRWAGTVIIACPSTTTEIALQFRADARPQSFLAPPACMLHLWSPQQGLISHLSHIGGFPGPYPFA
jgi:3',5'-cyclic-AMP phosphodiesterase